MSFEIHIRTRAVADLDAIHEHLSTYSTAAADRTDAQIKNAIRGLSEFPRRCAAAPESARASIEVRHVLVGKYRVLFSIIGNAIHVWRIRHGSQLTLDPTEMF